MTDFAKTKSDLRILRKAHDAKSPIGRAYSNLDEMLENFAKSTDRDQKKRLAANIDRENTRLAKLLAAVRQ